MAITESASGMETYPERPGATKRLNGCRRAASSSPRPWSVPYKILSLSGSSSACGVHLGMARITLAEARAALRARCPRLLRRNEVRREVAEHRQQLHIVKPRLACPVDGADQVAVGVHLHRLAARRERLLEHLRRDRLKVIGRSLSPFGRENKGRVSARGPGKNHAIAPPTSRDGQTPSREASLLLLLVSAMSENVRGAMGRTGRSASPELDTTMEDATQTALFFPRPRGATSPRARSSEGYFATLSCHAVWAAGSS